MSVLAFLSESFIKSSDKFYSHKASLQYIKACFDNDRVVAVGRVIDGNIAHSSVEINMDEFEEIYNYTSIPDFIKRCLRNPYFLINYTHRCDQLIDKYSTSQIWVRNPSIGCLIFSLRALKKDRKIYNHMCANAINAWDNEKYKGLTRVFAFLFSRVLKYLVIKVVSHTKTVNLCTGKELEDFCLKFNDNSYQIIDSNIRSTSVHSIESNKPFKFLFIGRIQYDKGISRLLEQFVRLDSTLFNLDVVGDGDILHELKQDFSRDNIVFHGQVSNYKLPEILTSVNAVVVPSFNKYEGFPRVILEAWSHGLPVLVADVGGVRSLVEHGKNGLLFNWDTPDQLLNLMKEASDKEIYNQLVENCKAMKPFTTEEYWVSEFKRIKLKCSM